MKKVFLTVLAAASLCACTGDLKDRVDTLETKVAALEAKVNENVSSIAKLADAAAKAVTIESVTPNEDNTGYIIKFSDGTTAVLTNGKDGENGKDGKDAVAPSVGVKEVDGVLYWTVNGEFMTSGGVKVPVTGKDGVDGKTPQFKIEDGKWFVSFDGKAWESVTVTGTVEPKLVMTETDTEYVFTLGETVIRIAKAQAFAIKVESYSADIEPSKTAVFKYTVTGADETTHVVAESSAFEVKVDDSNSTITVTAPKIMVSGYVIVKAVRNSDGKYSAQYISIRKNSYGTFGGIIVSDENEYLNW